MKIVHCADWIVYSGFHAIVSADVVEAIKEWGGNYITVEEDKPVTIMKAGGH